MSLQYGGWVCVCVYWERKSMGAVDTQMHTLCLARSTQGQSGGCEGFQRKNFFKEPRRMVSHLCINVNHREKRWRESATKVGVGQLCLSSVIHKPLVCGSFSWFEFDPLVLVKGTYTTTVYSHYLDDHVLPTLWQQFGEDHFLQRFGVEELQRPWGQTWSPPIRAGPH